MYRASLERERSIHPTTIAVTAGRSEGAGEPLGPPLVFASAFRAGGDHAYGRESNPTWEAFESAAGALDRGAAVAFGSGIAAAAAILELLPRGARVLVSRSAYVEVRGLLAAHQANGRLSVRYVDGADALELAAASPGVDLVWLDALANPGLDVVALDEIIPAVRAAGARLAVDATLATPVLMRPLELGADFVLHSATKFLSGHSDALLGVAVARECRLAAELREVRRASGSVPGTMEAWLGLRGLRTLAIRVERGCSTAADLARRLDRHPAVGQVRYPGLDGDPARETAARLLDDFGAVLSFELPSVEAAERVCGRVRLITHASSLGGLETVIDRPGRWDASPEVPGGMIRLSAGLEHPDDLWRDLEGALAVP